MARKLTDHESDASLSPFANDLSDQAESKVKTKTVTTGRKRKADTAEVQTTKRTRKTVAKTEDDVADIDEPPRTKGRVTKKTKVEEETMEEEVKVDKTSKSAQKVTKKKTTATRTKKQADLSPLAKRTEDTKVRIGAHVSTAGG
jgi:AP endonuclease-1